MFKAAKCPRCSESIQVPDDRDIVKCMFCGADLDVREAILLTEDRVYESTHATIDEKTSNYNGVAVVLIVLGAVFLFCGLPNALGSRDIGALIGALVLPIGLGSVGVYILVAKPTSISQVGYKGDCPYCGTAIHFPTHAVGLDCFACNKRIVFRNMKFLSVDTPVSSARPQNNP